MTSRRDAIKFSVLGTLLARFPLAYAQQAAGLTPAQYAALQKAHRTPGAVVRTPTLFVDARRGDDLKDGKTAATAIATLGELAKREANLVPGSVIGLANDSVFELSNAVVFRKLNGTADKRMYLTNYDPGGAPDSLPKIRYCFKPKASDWIWDPDPKHPGWYFAHPAGRKFDYAYVRFGDGNWGISYSFLKDYQSLKTTEYSYVSDFDLKRIYVHSPEGVNPTDHYGSVTIAGDEFGCLLLLRCGSYLTVENIDFEEAPNLIGIGSFDNMDAVGNITGFEMSNCHGTNVVSLLGSYADDHKYTVQVHVHDCSLQHYSSGGVRLGNNSANCLIEYNWFYDGGKCCTSAGAVYLQERPTTIAPISGTTVQYNFVDTYGNGIGDHPFDGAGLYCEINSNGCQIQNNIVINCRTALQDNSGRANSFIGNLLHCDKALLVTPGQIVVKGQRLNTKLIFDGNTVYSANGRNAYSSSSNWSGRSDAVISWHLDFGDTSGPHNCSLSARANVIRAAGFGTEQAVFGIYSYGGVAQLNLEGNSLSHNVPFCFLKSGIYADGSPAGLLARDPAGTTRLDLEALASSSYVVPGVGTIDGTGSTSKRDLLGRTLGTGSARGAIAG
ncbi:hypothetical protein SAMN05192549_1021 [Duganella sacchari]|uniref:Right handed beta helix region n=1 Tax=Duganella sacchari TaxID=551987 RepID=A0A1M7K8I5_9BURK|nr:hypothetical protein [Duganella sacchari]SHM61157.1 hypothetical protein SAMN05192549_1021 [Duganella sacchari]